MIKSKSHNVSLSYSEIYALEEYLIKHSIGLENFTNGSSYAASYYGITINCVSSGMADKVWDAVIIATDEREEEDDVL